MWMTYIYTGMQTHVLGLKYSSEVKLKKVAYNCNDEHYGLKSQIEGRLGVFVQPESPKENV